VSAEGPHPDDDPSDLTSRVEREKRFYDAKASSYQRVRHWITRAIGEFDRENDVQDYYDPRDQEVLDYGCGEGRLTFDLLRKGARYVTGIDVSEVRVDAARRRADHLGVADRCRFVTADAHATGFPDASFDLVVGTDVLHHLDLERALREIRRVLRPGGRAVFVEPLAHNPILRLGRFLTPSGRTPDEHPFTVEDWRLCASIFTSFSHSERELVTIPLMPLNLILPRGGQRAMARWARRTDDRLLERYPKLGKYARVSILVLS
jgi:ubiquinone/menaquinone biosynthesis C-methylase UbiE